MTDKPNTHRENMARKVFISFLGATNYGACHYCRTDEKGVFKSDETRYVQVATLDYLTSRESWSKDDVALILLTRMSHERNWVDNGHTDHATHQAIEAPGLRSCLASRGYPMSVKTLERLPDGNNQEEILEIFLQLFDEIQEGDELYFDITHGFRYLPMLVVSLGNYAKFLRGSTVKRITYGNFEARDRVTNEAQIMDLMSLSQLQDWTHAAAVLIQHGDARPIKEIFEKRAHVVDERQPDGDASQAVNGFINNLVAVTSEIQTCRGTSILKATNIKAMMQSLAQLQAIMPKPLSPIIEKISDSFSQYRTEFDVNNGWLAAQWSLRHHLLQQAATILQENAVSYFCLRNDIRVFDEHRREFVNGAIFIASRQLPQSEWKFRSDREIDIIERLLDDEKLTSRQFLETFNALSEIRNDLNHFGMRKKTKQWNEIQQIIENSYSILVNLLK